MPFLPFFSKGKGNLICYFERGLAVPQYTKIDRFFGGCFETADF